ncbi:hypothetical protein PM082_024823 [Marasmius tenuissimus]|nr:hypothetical protein PM082_024823 [Marasmius tenuissimus]
MGIASTLIIVRSALGIAISDEKSFRMTVLGTGGRNGRTRGVVDSAIDFVRQSTSVTAFEEEHPVETEDKGKRAA